MPLSSILVLGAVLERQNQKVYQFKATLKPNL